MKPEKLAWVVRANPHHISRITEFLKRDLVALGWPGLGSIAGKDIDEIRAALLRSYGKLDNRELGASAGALDMLVNRMSAGDYVLVPSPEDGAVYIGEVRGSYRYSPADEGDKYPQQRRVRWLLDRTRIPRAELPRSVVQSLKAHQPIFSTDAEAVEELIRRRTSRSDVEEGLAEPDTDGVIHRYEGEEVRVLSLLAKRDQRLRNDKIRHALKANGGRLVCEVPNCHFDFEKVYGPLGKGFAHVHHLASFASKRGRRLTGPDDLAIVCANCHAMLHRDGKLRRLDELIPRRHAIAHG